MLDKQQEQNVIATMLARQRHPGYVIAAKEQMRRRTATADFLRDNEASLVAVRPGARLGPEAYVNGRWLCPSEDGFSTCAAAKERERGG